MQLSLNEILAAFNGSLPLNLNILRELHGVQSIELSPDAASPLHLTDSAGAPRTLFLPVDAVIGATTLRNKRWDPNKQTALANMLTGASEDLTLIDVGANVGLFTRQSLNRIPQIKKAYCYEPNVLNFKLLSRNLGSLPSVLLHNYGLSDVAGSLDFHLDPGNAGNYSLNKSAMPANYRSTKVDVKEAHAEGLRWLEENDGRFIYKSDTQGFDEVISTSLDITFWARVKAGIFELWRLPGKEYDPDKFSAVLDSFPNKVFEKAPKSNVSTKQVLAYLDGTDMQYDDLYAWR